MPLRSLNMDVTINTLPPEVPHPLRCDPHHAHASYDPEDAQHRWRVLVPTDRVFKPLQVPPGPVQLGTMRPGQLRPGGQAPLRTPWPGVAVRVTRAAYAHEVSSGGFWLGSGYSEA